MGYFKENTVENLLILIGYMALFLTPLAIGGWYVERKEKKGGTCRERFFLS